MEKAYTFEDLVRIVAALRGEDGCPWDRRQTHGSLRTCMVEEAYEVVDGIRILEESGSWDNLCEELGDVLLQVVMHSQIAEEEKLFTLEDVVQGISEKMVRRHPHVFGNKEAIEAGQVPASWEEIKRQEKGKKDQKGLEGIPRSLPALLRTSKVLKKLESQGRDQKEEKACFRQARELLEKLEKNDSVQRDEELVGQLLMEICRISRKRNVNAEQALADILDKLR
ncbi:MAG: nucleoside triphosphate pyrophosphohydrolase [Ruminococcus sp.]|jgi:tetrapyrrole methylase family protein/MazG family protein